MTHPDPVVPAMIRNAVIRECLEALPRYVLNATGEWYMGIEQYAEKAHRDLTALLTPEPEQPESIQPMCERTLSAVIETMRRFEVDECHVRIVEALLPKPDPAKTLVEEAGGVMGFEIDVVRPLGKPRGEVPGLAPVVRRLAPKVRSEGSKQTDAATDDNRLPDEPLCERTIRACIEALPQSQGGRDEYAAGYDNGLAKCYSQLEALLPKSDPAEALVGEFNWCGHPEGLIAIKAFARWLLASHHIQKTEG